MEISAKIPEDPSIDDEDARFRIIGDAFDAWGRMMCRHRCAVTWISLLAVMSCAAGFMHFKLEAELNIWLPSESNMEEKKGPDARVPRF